jgi:hypothetical protein
VLDDVTLALSVVELETVGVIVGVCVTVGVLAADGVALALAPSETEDVGVAELLGV